MESPDIPETSSETAREALQLAALRAGDEAAFLSLVQRLHGPMLHVASLHVGSRAIAEEVVQEAWMGVLKGLDRFEGRSSLRTWIFRILVNCARTRSQREARTVPLSALEDDDADEPAVSPDRFQAPGAPYAGNWAVPPRPWAEAQVESGEMVALVREALERLPPAQRTVMTLRDVDGLDAAEVCELLGLTEVNQRVLLHRARSKVRSHVEARLGPEERA